MRKFIILIVLIVAQFVSVAQILEPVKWSFNAVEKGNEVILTFKATIDEHWHLYDVNLPDDGPVPTSFTFENEAAFEKIGKMTTSPTPIDKHDPTFDMQLRYFEKEVTFSQRVRIKDANMTNIEGYVTFMCCDDEQCLPPTDVDFSFKVSPKKADATSTAAKINEPKKEDAPVATSAPTEPEEPLIMEEETTQTVPVDENEITPSEPTQAVADVQPANDPNPQEDSSLWLFFLGAFFFGLTALATPCVFPMIPMTVSFFMHGGKSKAESRLHALFYGFSIIAIYVVIGTLIALIFGPGIANWLSTNWVPNLIFFLVFTLFAFSFFGMFEITLPSALVNRSDKGADKGGFIGAFFMALTLVLVSFSCTGPIVGLILVKSAGGEVLKPIVGMLGFSLAFALPFSLFAFFPSWLSNLPKSGGWLNAVKVTLGFIELALALKFLSIIDQAYHLNWLDRDIYLGIWIVLFTLLGFYLLGKLKFAHDSDLKFISVPRLMLAIFSFSFVAYMIPGLIGAPLKALSGYLPPMQTHSFNIQSLVREEIKMANVGSLGSSSANSSLCEKPKYAEHMHGFPHGLEGYYDYEQGMACAKALNKPVFIDFTGHGCVNCREMEANVWSDPRVLHLLKEKFVIIALYVDDKTDLPESEWVTSTYDGKVKKTIGKKFADFQISKFGVNAQPYYVLLDNEGKKLNLPKAYDLNPDNFVNFLEDGLAAFKN
ncbi:MAG: protein-disulfide reductase DsbD domain-containing protein [Mangrovibacterium sp.]